MAVSAGCLGRGEARQPEVCRAKPHPADCPAALAGCRCLLASLLHLQHCPAFELLPRCRTAPHLQSSRLWSTPAASRGS